MAVTARLAICAALATLAACSAPPTPPKHQTYAGLPLSGSMEDAGQAGFTFCVELASNLRCRRKGVTFLGAGPYDAAVDLKGRDGASGFTELTLWHDTDQNALFAIGEALERDGWTACLTGDGDRRGDQKLWTKPGSPVWVSMDISYWGRRRLRVIPLSSGSPPRC